MMEMLATHVVVFNLFGLSLKGWKQTLFARWPTNASRIAELVRKKKESMFTRLEEILL
jgi:hypothetical protein